MAPNFILDLLYWVHPLKQQVVAKFSQLDVESHFKTIKSWNPVSEIPPPTRSAPFHMNESQKMENKFSKQKLATFFRLEHFEAQNSR